MTAEEKREYNRVKKRESRKRLKDYLSELKRSELIGELEFIKEIANENDLNTIAVAGVYKFLKESGRPATASQLKAILKDADLVTDEKLMEFLND
ncbi:hypothetical protein [Vibrio campbellii]|uniref:hypothetical protein n=1 Tax=Vibrio campbellii TaxID=680 RepID=UPI003F83BDEE